MDGLTYLFGFRLRSNKVNHVVSERLSFDGQGLPQHNIRAFM